jgi:adenosylcobinamide-GDP ribazoletransferase
VIHQPVIDLPAAASPSRPRVWHGFAGGLRAALMLLTRIPTGSAGSSLAARGWASGWFPLVGALVGAVSAAAGVGAAALFGPHLGAVAAVAVAIVATGALHEDGLGDTADALGGARDRAQIFAILKDSRHGTYGVLALLLAVIVRIGAIDQLGLATWRGSAALVLAAMVSRTAMVALLAALPYVTPADVARSADVARTGAGPIALAAALCAGGGTGLVALAGLPVGSVAGAVVAVALTTLLLGWRFAVRAGGITGDFLGAGQQLTEISALLTTIALLR